MNCIIRAIIYSTTKIIFFDESFYRVATKKNNSIVSAFKFAKKIISPTKTRIIYSA